MNDIEKRIWDAAMRRVGDVFGIALDALRVNQRRILTSKQRRILTRASGSFPAVFEEEKGSGFYCLAASE